MFESAKETTLLAPQSISRAMGVSSSSEPEESGGALWTTTASEEEENEEQIVQEPTVK